MTRTEKTILLATPPITGLLIGLWRHRQLIAGRAMDLVIHLLAVPADKSTGW